MAQHISIMDSETRGLQKIAQNLCVKAEQGIWAIAGSLKFEELSHKGHKINSNDKVFITERTVNGKREMFELHYDTNSQELLDIFLVK